MTPSSGSSCRSWPLSDLRDRFDELGALLRASRRLWHPRPFVELPVAWEATHPAVARHVDRLPLVSLESAAWLRGAPRSVRRWARLAERLSALPSLAPTDPVRLSAGRARRIPGRKVAQLEALVGAIHGWQPAHPVVLDWCAGKGHLGRTLCRLGGGRLLALEIDRRLGQTGAALCGREGVQGMFVHADVLGPAAALHVGGDQLVVALHACGDLHAALLRLVARQPVSGLALVPCCYNRAAPDRGQAISAAGAAAGLNLDADDLDLLHRHTCSAGPATRQRTRQETAWRLGFDQLQRQLTGRDAYRTMPPFPRRWLRGGFADFCRRFAPTDGLEIPPDLDPSPFEALGWARYEKVLRRDAVRGLFRAPLEAWLVLDRALFLAEHGYRVRVGSFCAASVTPRNLLILARR